jgi:transposase
VDAKDNGRRHRARYGQNDCGIAVGRRNWTFCGSDSGGHRAAVFYTLIETCRLNGVDPRAWLADVLARIAELLPWNWQAARPPQVQAQAA